MNSERTLCTQCILPSTFPGISFNDQGVCSHCQRYKGRAVTEKQMAKYEQKFIKLLQEKRKNSTYDVLVAFSGGKDSTYTLDVLVNRYEFLRLPSTIRLFLHRRKRIFVPFAVRWELICLLSGLTRR